MDIVDPIYTIYLIYWRYVSDKKISRYIPINNNPDSNTLRNAV